MNEYFPTYRAGSTAIYGIIGALTMLIYKSHARALKYAQADHLYGFLKLRSFVESDMACSYETFI